MVSKRCGHRAVQPKRSDSGTRISVTLSLLVAVAALSCAPPVRAVDLLEPLIARAPFPPIPVRGDDGLNYLNYELQVTNMLDQPVTVTRVEVLDSTVALQNLEPKALAQSFRPFGFPREQWEQRAQADQLTLNGGMSGLLYLSIVLPEPQRTFGPLLHRISVETGAGSTRQARTIALSPVALGPQTVLHIGPPVRGGPWLAANGPSNISGHRRLPIPLNGRATIAQRFAIDYVKLDSRGRQFTGDWRDNRNYPTRGEQAIAVADAVVVAVKDGIAENIPDVTPTGDALKLETVYGNNVILDLGGGHFAIYAHLLPGTLRVKPNDRVRRGDTLALIGNTGNSIMPHLHFQLADSMAPLAGEGLPYVHDRFEWVGKCAMDDEHNAPPCELGPRQVKTDAIPLHFSVVYFP